MSFVGRLDQFKLSDVLQILAMGEKSGKIKLTQRDADGLIVMHRGKIIYAASSSARETLGHILICKHLITEGDLNRALEMQHKSVDEKRLGACLVELDILPQETIDDVVVQQIEKVVIEFLHWKGGFFKFEATRLENPREVEVDSENLLLFNGVSTDKFLLAAGADFDTLEETQEMLAATELMVPDQNDSAVDLSGLKAAMNQIRSGELTGEATWKILTYAQKLLRRGVLFVVRHDHFSGMGQFGVELAGSSPEATEERIRGLQIPVRGASILNEAAERKETVRSAVGEDEWNRYLVEGLGGFWPKEAVAIPMILEDRVFLVFYGDNAPDGGPIGSMDELEVLMLQVGLATERDLLERRLQQIQAADPPTGEE